MSTLDDLLSELESPVAAKKPMAAKPAAAAAAVNDDLDSLLADLGTPVGAKKSSPAPSAASSTPSKPKPAADDLDSLLSDLGSGSAPAAKKVATPKPAAATKPSPAKPAATDDLDSLLSDLGGGIGGSKPQTASNGHASPAPAKATISPAPAAKKVAPAKVDDLDSLLGDLSAPAPKKVSAASPAPAKAPAAKTDDLDSLLNDLGSPAPKAAAKKVAPAAKPAKQADDLDALMADLGSPAPAAKPVAATARAAPASKGDDLDALMADLGGPSAKPAPAAKKVGVASPAAKGHSGDELDSLMADLGGSSAKATSSFKVGNSIAPANSGAKARSDELDSLMDSLGGAAQPASKSTSNDLDDLMHTLSGPSTGAGMVAPPRPSGQVSRAPAGSMSRFDDLMSTVTADMNDLTSGSGARSRGVCYHCRQPIYDECMQALGRTYHPEHFMCGSCNNPLGTGSFFELAGQAHCQRCYQIQFCPKCAHCNQAITDRCVTALDKKWHIHCFVCTQCTSPFQGNFFERDGRPYCDKCFHQVFAPRCRSCNQPVLGDCVNALGAQWHPEHFNCQFCRRAFTGTFFEYEGMPYCEAHYYQKMGSSCSGCQQPISGACVDALGKKWHPEHFVCAFCMNKLEGTSYSEKNAKPYCRPCFGKLFGS